MRATLAILLSGLVIWTQAALGVSPWSAAGLARPTDRRALESACTCCPCETGQCCPGQRAPEPRPANPIARAATKTDSVRLANLPVPVQVRLSMLPPASSTVRPLLPAPVPAPLFRRHCALLL